MDLYDKLILKRRKIVGDGNLLSEDSAYNQELHMAYKICG
jgi:hypothetical protein